MAVLSKRSARILDIAYSLSVRSRMMKTTITANNMIAPMNIAQAHHGPDPASSSCIDIGYPAGGSPAISR